MEDTDSVDNGVTNIPTEMEVDTVDGKSQSDSLPEARDAEGECSELSQDEPLDAGKQRAVDGFVSMINQTRTIYQRQKATEYAKVLAAEHGAAVANALEKTLFAEGVQSSEANESAGEFVKLLEAKLESYVAELFAPGTGSVKVQSSAESDVVAVQILGTKDAPRNYLSANWATEWQLRLQPEFVEAAGAFKLHVHCWEEGNTQLESSCTFRTAKLHGSRDCEPEKLVDKIYWKIRDSEDAVQVRLNESYARTTEQALKRLRRQLPVTRTKMDWNKFAGYKLSSELGSSKV